MINEVTFNISGLSLKRLRIAREGGCVCWVVSCEWKVLRVAWLFYFSRRYRRCLATMVDGCRSGGSLWRGVYVEIPSGLGAAL